MGFSQADILLTTLNATYQHAAFGLRYLYANLGSLQERTLIREFTIAHKPRDVVESLLAHQPKIIGFGVYIWNTEETLAIVSILRAVAPHIQIILGGPEVSYEAQTQKICELAHYVVKGEADLSFPGLCDSILKGEAPATKWQAPALPDIKSIAFPYRYYTEEDIKNRLIYVEASRGCPYKCEFCLSSLDVSVRNFDLALFLKEMEELIARGARQFKFVDRTFNLSPSISAAILDFFLERIDLGLFLHFELVPDRLPDALKERIERFPAGSLQFEIGVQTWSPEVGKLISRRQDYQKIVVNFRYLKESTHVHTHADLIVGLPGEDLASFATGFDALSALEPDEIQVGMLKRLKGTPIIRHDSEWQMKYQSFPPFTILENKLLDFATVTKLDRFAKFWDLFANSGRFRHSIALLKKLSRERQDGSWFWQFWDFALFLNDRHPQRYAIALVNQVESFWIYLTQTLKQDEALVRECLTKDYCGDIKRDLPAFLKDKVVEESLVKSRRSTPSRQQRFLV